MMARFCVTYTWEVGMIGSGQVMTLVAANDGWLGIIAWHNGARKTLLGPRAVLI